MKQLTPKEVKLHASGMWLDIFQSLAPNLEEAIGRMGRHVPDPVMGGKDGFRLMPTAREDGAAYLNKSGILSDGFATLMYVLGTSFPDTKNMVANYLGLDSHTITKVPAPKKIKPFIAGELSPQEKEKRRGKLNSLWKQSSRLSSNGTRVKKYLESRGIELKDSSISNVRFHNSIWYKAENGNLCQSPAFIQLFQAADGTPVNIHKILLSNKTVGKAELPKSKLMMKPSGKMSGGAVRLGQPQNGRLHVSTGVENALSVTCLVGEACWATLGDSLLRGFIPPKGITELIIWSDNDPVDWKGRNSGVDSANALAEKLGETRPEIKVKIKTPALAGEDFNDILMSKKGL